MRGFYFINRYFLFKMFEWIIQIFRLFLGWLGLGFAALGFSSCDANFAVLLQSSGCAVGLGSLFQRVVGSCQELVTGFLGVTQLETLEVVQRCALNGGETEISN